jgi:hypothetical protein
MNGNWTVVIPLYFGEPGSAEVSWRIHAERYEMPRSTQTDCIALSSSWGDEIMLDIVRGQAPLPNGFDRMKLRMVKSFCEPPAVKDE